MFCIVMATPPPLEDEEDVDAGALELEPPLSWPPPHPAAARATTAHRASSIRLMFMTTPPRADPS
jgi:hypothetical protein